MRRWTWRIVVLGGALRELTLAHLCATAPQIPDIDVAVLSDFDTGEVINRLGRRTCNTNTFGGIRWQSNWSLPLDIWSARTWAERIGKPSRSEYDGHEIKDFLDFNVNAGIYAPDRDEVDVEDICDAISRRTLELHNSLVPPDSFQLARIIKLERRVRDFGFKLGPEIYRYVISVIHSSDPATLMEAKAYFQRKSGHLTGAAPSYFELRISQLISARAPAMTAGTFRLAPSGKTRSAARPRRLP